jgi:hypothetical protein
MEEGFSSDEAGWASTDYRHGFHDCAMGGKGFVEEAVELEADQLVRRSRVRRQGAVLAGVGGVAIAI